MIPVKTDFSVWLSISLPYDMIRAVAILIQGNGMPAKDTFHCCREDLKDECKGSLRLPYAHKLLR